MATSGSAVSIWASVSAIDTEVLGRSSGSAESLSEVMAQPLLLPGGRRAAR
jgi:hypothetical protein